MQIMIIAGGSRGDVQPYVALGVGLQAAGHTVRILAPMNFRELITAHGLEFFAMNDLTEAMTQERARELAEQGNLLKMLTAQGRCAAPCLALPTDGCGRPSRRRGHDGGRAGRGRTLRIFAFWAIIAISRWRLCRSF
jgi:hypothetical protein